MPFYDVLLSRDASESAHVLVEAETPEDAFDVARSQVEENQWELDEGNVRHLKRESSVLQGGEEARYAS